MSVWHRLAFHEITFATISTDEIAQKNNEKVLKVRCRSETAATSAGERWLNFFEQLLDQFFF